MNVHIPYCFCHLLQTYKFKCINKPKTLSLEEFFHMTLLVLIKGRYKEPISHMPPARFTSHHEWERPILIYTRPHLHAHTLIKTVGCGLPERHAKLTALMCTCVNDTRISKKVKTGTTSPDPIVSNSVSDLLQSSQVQEQMGFCTLFGALWFLQCRWNCAAQSYNWIYCI